MDLALMLTALGMAITFLYAPTTEMSTADYAQDFLITRVKTSNAVLGGVMLIAWHFAFKAYDLYTSYRLRPVSDIFGNVVKAVGVCSLSLLIAAQLGSWRTITVTTVLLFWFLGVTLVGALRMAVFRTSQRFRKRGRNTKTLLVIGGGHRAQQLMRKIAGRSELGYQIVGYVDSSSLYREKEFAGAPWLGGFDTLNHILDEHVIDEVAIALPIKSLYSEIQSAIDRLEAQGIAVHVLSDFFPRQLARLNPTEFQGLPLLSFTSTPPFCWKMEVKRLIDLVLSCTLLIAGAPLFLLAALLIKLDSRGPVFFSQERMGYNKRRFMMVKFRTMVTDAEARMAEIEHLNEKDGPIFKIKNDPRITRVGRVLRKFSIDELPQLFNVLMGDMSLVGPRPLSIRDALNLEESRQKRRFSVKPGLTCLWQISGRSNLSFDEWVDLDLEYIDGWSLHLDWWILLKTIPAVISARGAV
jgi:exopolysaccharide biosynthesis polyprenyl glycosylphosphotransferase